MSELNPYQSPAAPSAGVTTTEGAFIASGRAVDIGHSWDWIVSGFGLFKKQPGMWILIVIAYFLIVCVLSVIPLIGSLANMLLYPVFTAGLMLGCRVLEQSEGLEFGHLFAGFKQNTGNLVVLGLLTLVGWIIILIPMMVIVGGGAFFAVMRGDPSAVAAFGLTFFLALLVVLALSIPLYMALWFAPSLIVFHKLAPVEAMKSSFFACLKNIAAFLLYGVILLALSVIAAIPFGLGFLILVPVIIASIYTAYRDVYFVG